MELSIVLLRLVGGLYRSTLFRGQEIKPLDIRLDDPNLPSTYLEISQYILTSLQSQRERRRWLDW